MALKVTVTTPQGFKATGAYHRISFIRLNGKTACTFVLSSCKDKDSVSFDDRQFDCPYDLAGANPLQQAYAYVKTLPGFELAEDC